ncbi:4-amino-4-deoxychorismate lyase [Motilibacter sp. K478]|nr:aminotransferase class IV [Motilibacter aurantiacus]NHC46087.1 4-amino-4-deoxychorismate lyase [Motilibacter aurantiacus]
MPGREARVSALDSGLTIGDGVFETVRVDAGTPLALTRHLDRLAASALRLGIRPPAADAVRTGVGQLLAAAPRAPRQRLRVTVTAGPGPLGPGRGTGPATLVLAVAALAELPAHAAVVTSPFVRNERSPLAAVKSVSYAESAWLLAEARRRGADETLVANTRGELCEGAAANVFVVLGGRLVTPPLSSGCLPGITRALVLETTGAVEETFPYAALADVEEAFLTSSLRHVTSVARIDDRLLMAPTRRTREAASALAALLVASPDP